MKTKLSVFVLLVALGISCDKADDFTPSYPEHPVNLTEINSQFDDFNSTSPIAGEISPICFSTNRSSAGLHYDILCTSLRIQFSKQSGVFSFTEERNLSLDEVALNRGLGEASAIINSQGDEWGPYLIKESIVGNGIDRYQSYIILYSSNKFGSHDIFMTENTNHSTYSNPLPIEFLNSEYDEAYVSIKDDSSELFFSSNRSGNWKIYTVELDSKVPLLQNLRSGSDLSVREFLEISSPYDDRCPFIFNDIIVFSSDREGGYGGFDLYYSIYKNGKWGTPINFGASINSAQNEYRPIIKSGSIDFANDIMIFSSDRVGGSGGYDLYLVGVSRDLK